MMYFVTSTLAQLWTHLFFQTDVEYRKTKYTNRPHSDSDLVSSATISNQRNAKGTFVLEELLGPQPVNAFLVLYKTAGLVAISTTLLPHLSLQRLIIIQCTRTHLISFMIISI